MAAAGGPARPPPCPHLGREVHVHRLGGQLLQHVDSAGHDLEVEVDLGGGAGGARGRRAGRRRVRARAMVAAHCARMRARAAPCGRGRRAAGGHATQKAPRAHLVVDRKARPLRRRGLHQQQAREQCRRPRTRAAAGVPRHAVLWLRGRERRRGRGAVRSRGRERARAAAAAGAAAARAPRGRSTVSAAAAAGRTPHGRLFKRVCRVSALRPAPSRPPGAAGRPAVRCDPPARPRHGAAPDRRGGIKRGRSLRIAHPLGSWRRCGGRGARSARLQRGPAPRGFQRLLWVAGRFFR
jgi:hypothetical protein